MREDHKRLRELIIKQLENNGIKRGTKRANEAEIFMIIGYLGMQAEIHDRLDPYLTMLVMSGRLLTDEPVEKVAA